MLVEFVDRCFFCNVFVLFVYLASHLYLFKEGVMYLANGLLGILSEQARAKLKLDSLISSIVSRLYVVNLGPATILYFGLTST